MCQSAGACWASLRPLESAITSTVLCLSISGIVHCVLFVGENDVSVACNGLLSVGVGGQVGVWLGRSGGGAGVVK